MVSPAPLPLPLQKVSARVWRDEVHVDESRAIYHEKFRLADRLFEGVPGFSGPEGGFFLWLPVENGEAAALKLWRETGIRSLPGTYLSRPVPEELGGGDPGARYLRLALVAPADDVRRGLQAVREVLL